MGQYTLQCVGWDGGSGLGGSTLYESWSEVNLYFALPSIPAGERIVRILGMHVYLDFSANGIQTGEEFRAKHLATLSLGRESSSQWHDVAAGEYLAENVIFGNQVKINCTKAITGASSIRIHTNDDANRPTLTIETEPVSFVLSDLQPTSTTKVYRGFVRRFSWSRSFNGLNVFGSVQQSYATFRYRAPSGDIREVRVPGSQNYIDFDTVQVPSYTGMEWQIMSVSNSGGSSYSTWASNDFSALTIRFTDLVPQSRSTRYKGFPVEFAWNFSYSVPEGVSGVLHQISAKLRWRKNGTTAITEYTISTSAQSYTIPAGVLPAGDIDWQVEMLDTSGGTTASSWTTFNYKELSVTPTELYPAEGSRILKHQVNRFGWTITAEEAEDVPGPIVQTSAVVRYRTKGQQDVQSVTVSGDQNFYDFPAHTFTADDIEWQVEVTANTGTVGVSEWVNVNTQDALSTPVCVSPVGVVVDDTNGVSFVWRHVISTGTEQTAYELQTSVNMGGQYTTLSTEESNASHFDTPAGTFEQGTLMWRVRTKNGDGEWGSYSAAATIIIRRAPATPVIVYTDTKPRPTIRWQSADQQGVCIQIGDYDTGWMHSTAKEFRMPMILPDGVYQVRLTIKTIFGVESPAAVATITVKNLPGPEIIAGFQAVDNCVNVEWQEDDAYTTYYVLRDGIPIARVDGNSYADRMSNGQQQYVVRGITPDGYYGDSAPVYAYVEIQNAVIGLVDAGAEWLTLRMRRGERPTHEGSYSIQAQYVHYYGRRKPVAYTIGMEDASHDFAFTVKPLLAENLHDLIGRTVVYKDHWGNVVIGLLGTVQIQHDRVCDVQFSITETDYHQEVSYEDG